MINDLSAEVYAIYLLRDGGAFETINSEAVKHTL
jgi:hypothetical protein